MKIILVGFVFYVTSIRTIKIISLYSDLRYSTLRIVSNSWVRLLHFCRERRLIKSLLLRLLRRFALLQNQVHLRKGYIYPVSQTNKNNKKRYIFLFIEWIDWIILNCKTGGLTILLSLRKHKCAERIFSKFFYHKKIKWVKKIMTLS